MIGNKRICIILPAYNAALTLEKTVAEIPMDVVDDVILVDDASSDDTMRIAKRLGVYA
jgi:glycosyltransferase involved in cell wall biosynthesis